MERSGGKMESLRAADLQLAWGHRSFSNLLVVGRLAGSVDPAGRPATAQQDASLVGISDRPFDGRLAIGNDLHASRMPAASKTSMARLRVASGLRSDPVKTTH
jgi:hypothetical protein